MNGDPLSNFRRKTANASPEIVLPGGGDDYVAFAAKDRVERLKIKRAKHPTHAPGYSYLLDIIYDGQDGTDFVLVYTILGVKVTGKNLQPVIMALLAGTADYIQEYDRAKWPKPSDPKAPLIESIEIVVQDNAQPAAQTGSVHL
jgi:hypothetical protein